MDMGASDKYPAPRSHSNKGDYIPAASSTDSIISQDKLSTCSTLEPTFITPPVPLPRRGIPEPPPTDGYQHPGYEPEGGSDNSSPGGGEALSTSPPNYLEWAKSFNTLLNDPDGLDLFRKYLAAENQSDLLEFWFACEGLKKQNNQEQTNLIIKCIYRRYFKDSRLGLSEEVFSSVLNEIRHATRHNTSISSRIFSPSQSEVEKIINNVVYRNFLQSDTYLNYIHHMTHDSCTSESASSSSGSRNNLATQYSSSSSSSHHHVHPNFPPLPPPPPPPYSSHHSVQSSTSNAPTTLAVQIETLTNITEGSMAKSLPTLHEDSEFSHKKPPSGPPRLTKDLLLATCKKRNMSKAKPEAFVGNLFLKNSKPNPYALAYTSYNTVSRHDSDIQSLSSDARSGSDLSLNTSAGGNNTLNRPKHQRSDHQHPPKNQIFNREDKLMLPIIPRTRRGMAPSQPNDPQEFVNTLVSKLNNVLRQQESDERLNKRLDEGIGTTPGLSNALSERFPRCDDDDQQILDQHIESVIDKIGLSPGFTTPHRPKSPNLESSGDIMPLPPRGVRLPLPPPPPLLPKPTSVPMSRLEFLKQRAHRDRDGSFEMFTSDSGNVQDLTEGSETYQSYNASSTSSSMHKSRSMPECAGDLSNPSCSRQGSRRYIPKRTDSQIFDSGISGISYSSNTLSSASQPQPTISSEPTDYLKNSNVARWVMENSATTTLPIVPDKDAMSSSSVLRHTTTVKHKSKSGSRSCSSERPNTSASLPRMHLHVLDPSMPPLPRPNTPTQLDEVSRRLWDDDSRANKNRVKPQLPTPGNTSTVSSSVSATLRPPRPPSSTADPASFTTVVFTFCDEQYPYRTKIPFKPVTLKQFKDYLPKKGSYRYFFKTECDDVDTKVIQEEIMDDNEILPLWEGKIMGQVKPLEHDMGHY